MSGSRNDLVTLILPVYNTAAYLPQCVESVLGQSYEDFEIICVDDGSTDESFAILQDYARRDTRVKVFSQKNQGAGSARNTGLNRSSGEWVSFLDSDDYLHKRYIERLIESVHDRHADLAVCCAVRFDTQTELPLIDWDVVRLPWPVSLDDCTFNAHTDLVKPFLLQIAYPVWGKLYNHSLLEGLAFHPTIRRFEDIPFVVLSLLRANAIVCLREQLYYYRCREGSTTSAVFAGRDRVGVLCDFLEVLRMSRPAIEKDAVLAESFKERCLPLLKGYHGALRPEELAQTRQKEIYREELDFWLDSDLLSRD